jgi:hypothetical protein
MPAGWQIRCDNRSIGARFRFLVMYIFENHDS